MVDGDLFGCLCLIGCFVLGRRGVAGVVGDAAVDALVVEPIDVRHGRELDIFKTPPGALPVDEFPFVKTVERLNECVVVAVAFRSDRRDDVVVGEPFGIGNRQILSQFNRSTQRSL